MLVVYFLHFHLPISTLILWNSLMYTNLYFLIVWVFLNIVFFRMCSWVDHFACSFLVPSFIEASPCTIFCPPPPQFCSDCLLSRFLKSHYLSSLIRPVTPFFILPTLKHMYRCSCKAPQILFENNWVYFINTLIAPVSCI